MLVNELGGTEDTEEEKMCENDTSTAMAVLRTPRLPRPRVT
jgi:hypothetical protein